VARWFGPDAPTVHLDPGAVLLRDGERNTRLYRIRSGSMLLRSGNRTEVTLGPANLVGIQSVFLNRWRRIYTDVAYEPCELAWLDLAEPPPEGSSWERELMPLVIAELRHRQQRVREMEAAHRTNEHRLQELIHVSTLGQMAAGVAHELNNALAVLGSGAEWLRSTIRVVGADAPPLQRRLLELGLASGHRHGVADAAPRAAALRKRGMGFAEARRISGLPLEEADVEALLADPQRATTLRWFELGATIHDMTVSARQGTHVVTSLKQLAARERLEPTAVDVAESLEVARSICRNSLHGIELTVEAADCGTVEANQGELVQVWTNLLQNACDALHANGTETPRIRIEARSDEESVTVRIADNGPGIAADLLEDIFLPGITTKHDGLHVGLGLGLGIGRQIVRRYGGSVSAANDESGGAVFTVVLSRRMGPTTAWSFRRESDRRVAGGER